MPGRLKDMLSEEMKAYLEALQGAKEKAAGGDAAAAQAVPVLMRNIGDLNTVLGTLNKEQGKQLDQTKKQNEQQKGLVYGLDRAAQSAVSWGRKVGSLPGRLMDLVRPTVGAANQGGMSTLTKSWQMVLGELGIKFIPTIIDASRMLQDFAGIVRNSRTPVEGFGQAMERFGKMPAGSQALIGGAAGYMLGGVPGAVAGASLGVKTGFTDKEGRDITAGRALGRTVREIGYWLGGRDVERTRKRRAEAESRGEQLRGYLGAGRHERELYKRAGDTETDRANRGRFAVDQAWGDVFGRLRTLGVRSLTELQSKAGVTNIAEARRKDTVEKEQNLYQVMRRVHGGGLVGQALGVASLVPREEREAAAKRRKHAHDLLPAGYQPQIQSFSGIRDQGMLKALGTTGLDQKMYEIQQRFFTEFMAKWDDAERRDAHGDFAPPRR